MKSGWSGRIPGASVSSALSQPVRAPTKIALTLGHFADHVEAGLFQRAVTLLDFLTRRPHGGALSGWTGREGRAHRLKRA